MAATNSGSFAVAAVQAAPVFLDRDATIEKACNLIKEAGKNRARLVVLPEAFVPAYPDWVWVLLPGKRESLHRKLYGELLDQAVDIPSPATDRLCKAAKEAKAYVAIGVNERNSESSGASIYNTLLYIGADGEIMGKHRKLMPPFPERPVWDSGHRAARAAYCTELGQRR